ncbi:hypothetical protein [Achromobacter xylosoxidans]|uniref:VWFA domain-containing protein n=1 Tax=Alcaligenes xylosoxydans xylosoxydans TaxID=85698 RepID=A0A1R1JR06_ALCXX|nr:hypothetical protein [Achromobacter xylosoxidans]OMG83655.1 hypothetical protein BIZ92_29935 [Achromobacter xylosoxidans]
MQRFLRDPRVSMSEASLSGAYGERIALIRKHFAPGVAAVYAIPRLGDDGVLEWWTSQQGMVKPYAALNGDAQQALLRAYDAHLATLDGLIEAMRARGLTDQAGQILALRTAPVLEHLYDVDGRLLVRMHDAPPSPPPDVAPPSICWRWIALAGLLLLAAILAALWWWHRQPVQPPVVALEPVLEPKPEQKPEPPPTPKPEPVRDSTWPTELVLVMETAERMKKPAKGQSGRSRMTISRTEIQRIVTVLPKDTVTQLITFPEGECRPPLAHGAFPAAKRTDLVQVMQGAQPQGRSSVAESLKMAAASVDGVKRDALVFAFIGGEDTCGANICSVVKQLVRAKPRLRINIVDLSSTESVADCLVEQRRVGAYVWGNRSPDLTEVDLSKEASRMLGGERTAK